MKKKQKICAPKVCAIIENAGYPVCIVECSKYNIKITDTQDLMFFTRIK